MKKLKVGMCIFNKIYCFGPILEMGKNRDFSKE